VGQMNSQGNFDAPDTLNEDQLDQMEQSDRLGGAGTLLGNESIDQVDGTDQNELAARSGGQAATQDDTRADAMGGMNSYSGMPTDSADASSATTGAASSAWSASSGVAGSMSSGTSDMSGGMSGRMASGAGDNGMDDPQVQAALNPNGQGNGMGSGKMAKDPVCGTMVDMSTAQHTLPAPVGSAVDTLYFDTPECKALFEANPDQYIANYDAS
jgi:YHS domain-containing protein